MTVQKIYIASDHAGYAFKQQLKEHMTSLGLPYEDLGTHSEESVDYPDYGNKVALAMRDKGEGHFGVMICGTGIGISISANRHLHIRAAVCHNSTEARLARAHNNANVLAMGARIVGLEVAKDMLKAFIETPFEGGRHALRVNKLSTVQGES